MHALSDDISASPLAGAKLRQTAIRIRCRRWGKGPARRNDGVDAIGATLRQSRLCQAAIDGEGRVAHTTSMDQPFSYGSGQKLRLMRELAGQLKEKFASGRRRAVPLFPRFYDRASSFENGWRIIMIPCACDERRPLNRCKLNETGPQFDWKSQHIGCWNEAQ